MSGIEAVFGAVASGAGLISLSIQLAESAIKLKRLYEAAKDAPRAISALISDLETMAMALQQIEQSRQQGFSADALLARCIAGCQTSTAEIWRLVDKMEDYSKRHAKMGQIYFAFKGRDVQTWLSSLERAKSSLQLAYTLYRAEEQQRWFQDHAVMLVQQGILMNDLQTRLIEGNASLSQQLSLLPTHSSSPYPAENEFIEAPSSSSRAELMYAKNYEAVSARKSQLDTVSRYTHPMTGNSRKSIRKPYFRASLRLPNWLGRQVFELAATRAEWGWNIQLRTFNLVPDNAPIFKYCRKGNLAGVRRLIDSGLASPLDVTDDQLTVLEAAACSGNSDLCRYLLAYGAWPDRGALMNNALVEFSVRARSAKGAGMYRIFLEDPDFDTELKESYTPELWLRLCDNMESLDVILQNQPTEFSTYAMEFRLEVAMQLWYLGAPGFLRCIGLHSSDPRLTSLREDDETTILHTIAGRIRHSFLPGHRKGIADGWVALGSSVLQNKGDLVSIRRGGQSPDSTEWCSTPLMECLGIGPNWEMSSWSQSESHTVRRRVYLWAEMVQLAGLDLLAYGMEESGQWNSLGIKDTLRVSAVGVCKVVQLVYGPTPADWGLKISPFWGFKMYRLQPPPGAFSIERPIPSKLAWNPTLQEQDEGPWTMEERRVHVGECYVVKSLDSTGFSDLSIHTDEPFVQIIDGTQDDTGVIMLMQDRVSRAQRIPARSHSQPPCLRRREVAHYGSLQAYTRPWLPRYHLCPSDSTWRVGCIEPFGWDEPMDAYDNYAMLADNAVHEVFDVRSCVKGFCSNLSSLQQSLYWYWKSFLSKIAACQDGGRSQGSVDSLRHTRTPDCPQGCAKVHLGRMNVPETLRRSHPVPDYAYDEDDDNDDAV